MTGTQAKEGETKDKKRDRRTEIGKSCEEREGRERGIETKTKG